MEAAHVAGLQTFCARTINLCQDILDANTLTDLDALKRIADSVRNEALSISKALCP